MSNYTTKPIKIPIFCEDLAEETGIHIGDGCMHILKRGNSYSYEIASHLVDDKDYTKYMIKLMKRLYNIVPSFNVKRNSKALSLKYFSKSLLEFKNNLGLPLGPKKNIKIPNWIFSDDKYIKACTRGIVDTDGTITFSKKYRNLHYYPLITITSISKTLIDQLVFVFSQFEINVSCFDDNRKDKDWNCCWKVQISGVDNLIKYLKNFGFSNQKHITKLKIWEKYGFCPPSTGIIERKLILEGKLNPYSFYECLGPDLNRRPPAISRIS